MENVDRTDTSENASGNIQFQRKSNEEISDSASHISYSKGSLLYCKAKENFIVKLITWLYVQCLNYKEFFIGCNIDGGQIFGDIVFKFRNNDGNFKVVLVHVDFPWTDNITFKALDSDKLNFLSCFKQINGIRENFESCKTLRDLGNFTECELVFYTCASIVNNHSLKCSNCSSNSVLNTINSQEVIYSIYDESCGKPSRHLEEVQMYIKFLEGLAFIQNSNEIDEQLNIFCDIITSTEIKNRLQTLKENLTQEIVQELYSEVNAMSNITSHYDVLSKFRMYSKQANVETICKLIKNEILQVESICEFGVHIMYKYLFKEIEEWLKHCYYLTKNSDMWNKFHSKLEYCREMPKCYIDIMSTVMVRYFVFSTKSISQSIFKFKVLNIIASSQEIFLSCLKLYQVLEQVAGNKYLWIPFSTLLHWTEDVLQLWFSDSFPLLVIECKTGHEDFKNVVTEIVQILRMHEKKYVIIISAGKNNFVSRLKNVIFPDDYCELKDNFKYSDFDDLSQLNILGSKVKFQGEPATVGSLIGPYDKVAGSLNASIITELLLKKDNIIIGPPISNSIVNYIPRILDLSVELDINIIKTISDSEVFIISGTSMSELRKILVNEDIQTFYLENQGINKEGKLFLSSRKYLRDGFSSFCEHFPSKNIHHLLFKNGSLLWQESRGQIKYLKDFLIESENAKHICDILGRSNSSVYNPVTLLDSIQHYTVILGDSGIGKSTLLCALQKETKKEYPLHWLVHLDFSNDIKLIVNTTKEDYDCDIIIQIMFSLLKIEHHASELERILLRHTFEKRGNIIIICEGLEYVKPIYFNKVLDFIHALNTLMVKKLWCATSPQLKSSLEKSFKTVVSEIRPLTSDDQTSLLYALWKGKCCENKQSQLKEFIERIQRVFYSSKSALLSLPLICVLTAEIFETQLIEYLSSSTVHWPENIDISQICDRLISCRGTQLYNNSDQNVSELHEKEEFFINKHMLCALCSLLDLSELNQLKLLDIFENVSNLVKEVKKYGIIQTIINKKPIFLHKTFAEYFVAMFFSKNIEKSRDLLREKMFTSNFKSVQRFFDHFLIKGHELHTAVLNNDCRVVKTLLDYGVDRNLTDKAGRSALHLAIIYSPHKTSTFPKSSLEDDVYDPCTKLLIDYCVNTKMTDNVLLWRPFQYAIEFKKWDAMDLLLKEQIDFNDIDCFKEKLKDESFVQGGLRIGSEKGYFNLIECFSSCGVNVIDNVIETNEGMYSPLHVAAKFGQLKLVRYLLSKKAKLSIKNDKGISPLHLAANEGMIEVVAYLLQRGADLHCADKDGNTPLNFSIFRINVHMTVLLVEQYQSNINIQNKFGDSPLHHAVKIGHITIIEYLLMKGAHIETCNQDGNTALHLAVWMGLLPAVKVLLEYGANVNACNKYGDTPLTRNACGGDLEIVKILVDRGAEINKRSEDGNTALHWAARQNNVNIVEYLLSKGANIDAKNKYGNTALHRAVEHGCLDTTKFLINAGCNIQLKNLAGLTAVKMRSRSKDVTDCISCL